MGNREYFNKVASEWDKMRKEFFSEDVRETAFDLAQVEPDKTAADIGAGTGFVTEGLLKRGLNVICVDHSEEMLKYLNEKFPDSNVDIRIGDSENLPIEDESADYVFANMYLHHVERPSHAIKEMTRILRNGGKIVITDVDEHNFEFLLKEQQDRWAGFKREDIKIWFEKANLVNVTVDRAGHNCCAESQDTNENASISIFTAYGEKK